MKPAARRKARALAVQAIYSWQLTANPVGDVEESYLLEHADAKVDREYFCELLRGTTTYCKPLDEKLGPYLSRNFDDLDQVEKAILRLAAFELCYRQDVPYKVVINEAIELAKQFAAQDSHRFVNGVLDKAVKVLRADEFKG